MSFRMPLRMIVTRCVSEETSVHYLENVSNYHRLVVHDILGNITIVAIRCVTLGMVAKVRAQSGLNYFRPVYLAKSLT